MPLMREHSPPASERRGKMKNFMDILLMMLAMAADIITVTTFVVAVIAVAI